MIEGNEPERDKGKYAQMYDFRNGALLNKLETLLD